MGATLEFTGETIEHVPPRTGERYGGALLVKRAGNRAADPARRPGDEGGLASQIEHHRSSTSRLGEPEYRDIVRRSDRNAARAIARARPTPAFPPEPPPCPPPLSFAAWQTWPCAASAATPAACSKSSPSSAAMAPVPTGTAFCIARPRRRRSRAVSAIVRAPAAASAEYSPSECPATNRASRARST